jgi:hypothetical protein
MSADSPEQDEADARQALPPIDFSTYVLSLASSANICLGRVPAPTGETMPPDLEMAHQLIDVLGMLQEKTRGNLDEGESKLLSSLLYDLRVTYVDVRNAAK